MISINEAFRGSDLPLKNKDTGKVRDWYSLGAQRRLIVTTDRLSAFDRILTCLPYKGQVLNELSLWWFENTKDIIANHLISCPDPNAIVVKEVKPLPIEVIVRGFITGVTQTALWYRYSLGERNIYGYDFPDGLEKNDALPKAIITPTTKGGITGHDERLTCDEVVSGGYLTEKVWNSVKDAALKLFKRGQERASKSGLILVDTKYEFGIDADENILLIDEVHTPDSSRYWKADTYQKRRAEGLEPENFDKEFIRLKYAEKGYRGDGNIPDLDESAWKEVTELYIAVYEKITQKKFSRAEYPVEKRLLKNLQNAGIIK
ncbi:MAG: phosphoribosylaminoimidazolesuccinocarboxamide synthase [Treponema sp.]|nr:MAG: phosphoribosylaminoimidazolesuccinocarboxamide synthase [Treponema sp.]